MTWLERLVVWFLERKHGGYETVVDVCHHCSYCRTCSYLRSEIEGHVRIYHAGVKL